MTFQDLAQAYLTRHLSTTRSFVSYQQLYRRYFSTWTDHKTRFEIRAWHLAQADTPSHANKGLGFLKAMYAWGQNTGDETGQRALWEGDNPARGVRRHPTYSRERVFTDAELATFFLYLDFHYQKLSVYLTVLLCTACRMSEARHWKWTDVEMTYDAHGQITGGCWHKPITKNGKSQRLPLPRQAAQAVMTLPRTTESIYIFEGLYHRPWSRSMAEKAWRKVALDMGLHGVTLHDFRRTVASRIYAHTKDEKLVKAILNHFDGGPTAVYVRLNYDYIARELQAHADRLWSLKHDVSDTTTPPPRVYQSPSSGSTSCQSFQNHHGRL